MSEPIHYPGITSCGCPYIKQPDPARHWKDCHYRLNSERDAQQTEQQPTVKDCLTVQPIAYAVFADNGNVACFSTQREHPSLVAFEADGHSVVSLAPIAQTVTQDTRAISMLVAEAAFKAGNGHDRAVASDTLRDIVNGVFDQLGMQTAPQPEQSGLPDPRQWTDQQVLDFLGVALRNVDVVGTVQLNEIRQGFELVMGRADLSAQGAGDADS